MAKPITGMEKFLDVAGMENGRDGRAAPMSATDGDREHQTWHLQIGMCLNAIESSGYAGVFIITTVTH